jgi:uncharacterized DUF497 family protein
MAKTRFEWDSKKDHENRNKHGVSFAVAQFAFADPNRVIAEDRSHSSKEKRHYCFGLVENEVLTVRFTYRGDVIRIFGAGYWRKGKQFYERENKIHK